MTQTRYRRIQDGKEFTEKSRTRMTVCLVDDEGRQYLFTIHHVKQDFEVVE